MEFGVQLRPRNIDRVRTRSMEYSLQPFIDQVSTLVGKRYGHGTKFHGSTKLVNDLDRAQARFVAEGRKIGRENREIEIDMRSACDRVESTGKEMHATARDFLDNPCSSARRNELVESARELLTAVTDLLIIADAADVIRLKSAARQVDNWLQQMERAASPDEVTYLYRGYGNDLEKLLKLTSRRQTDVKSPSISEKLALARLKLKRINNVLLNSMTLHVKYPDVASAKVNRDFALSQASEAVRSIIESLDEDKASRLSPEEERGHAALLLEEFKADVDRLLVEASSSHSLRPDSLSRLVASLDRKVTQISDEMSLSLCGESTRKFRLKQVSSTLASLQKSFVDIKQILKRKGGLQLEKSVITSKATEMIKMSKYLKTQMSRCAVDDVCDLFYDVDLPLALMVEPARIGNKRAVEQRAKTFRNQAERFYQASKLVSSFSPDPQSIKRLRWAMKDIQFSYTQVINAARSVAFYPSSLTARKNLESFEDLWINQVKLLTRAVDDVVDIDDFLIVSEYHLLEELKSSMLAVQVGNPESMEIHLAHVKGIVRRFCDVTLAKVSQLGDRKYDEYVKSVENAIASLERNSMRQYGKCIDEILDQLNENDEALFDERQCSQKAKAVLHGVRRVRHVVQSIRTDVSMTSDPDEAFLDDDIEPDLPPPPPDMLQDDDDDDDDEEFGVEHVLNHLDLADEPPPLPRPPPKEEIPPPSLRRQTSSRTFIREDERHVSPSELGHLSDEQKRHLHALREEKRQLEREVDKFGEVNSDIVTIAKDMGMMMIDMSDFTRGAGPLKTAMDVFDTAKEIAHSGKQLDLLGKQLAKECPDESFKADLLSYLQRVSLYCHQINITSRVKADVTSRSGEKNSQSLENATTLVAAAKNLMNAVVHIVKLSYVAMNKIAKAKGVHESSTSVSWRARIPDKKPLVRAAEDDEKSGSSQESGGGAGLRLEPAFSTIKAMKTLQDFRSYKVPSLSDEPEEDEWV